MPGAAAPGFFGKVRSHGDFVGRRLPHDMRAALDAWLQGGLLQSRHDLGAAWQPTWLSSPLWRFMLAPGLCGAQAWAGVMMPSVDRVGRCFPLVLAAPFERAPSLPDCLTRHAAWFVRLEDIALSSLDDDFSLEVFDAALLALEGAPSAHDPAAAAPASGQPTVAALDGGVPPALAFDAMVGASAWWGDGSALVAPCLARCGGLPAPQQFAALLDGGWSMRGWVRR